SPATGGDHPLGQVIALSPDGRILAAARSDSILQLWDLDSGKELSHRTGEQTRVTALAFSPDGRSLAAGHEDGSILIWQVKAPGKRLPAPPPAAAELRAWWADLVGDDGHKVHAAIVGLGASPAESVPFLAERLRPAAGLPAGALRQLVADLDSDQFARRDAA